MLDPAALQQALAQHGIPGPGQDRHLLLVEPRATRPGQHRCADRRATRRHPVLSGPHPVSIDNDVTVINPAAMPAGTELFLGYFNSGRIHALQPGLIYTRSYTCSTGLPPGGPAGS